MIRLATSSVELVNTLMKFHMKHMEGKYKRKFYDAQVRLLSELRQPPHLKMDSVIDDLRDQLVMLLDNFRQEIEPQDILKKDL